MILVRECFCQRLHGVGSSINRAVAKDKACLDV